jgi:hypothetical protein
MRISLLGLGKKQLCVLSVSKVDIYDGDDSSRREGGT